MVRGKYASPVSSLSTSGLNLAFEGGETEVGEKIAGTLKKSWILIYQDTFSLVQ